jgi:hypothetical protein
MNREELLRLFSVDENDIIQTEGQFKGQPLYVAYFWLLYITGYSDERSNETVTFLVRGEDRAQFRALQQRRRVLIQPQPDGRIVEVDG